MIRVNVFMFSETKFLIDPTKKSNISP